MQQERSDDVAAALESLLNPGEQLAVAARAVEAILAVTDRRMIVKASNRVALDAEFKVLRRIQFDIERRRPAVLVIVPDDATHEPQVLTIPPAEIPGVSTALAIVSGHFAELEPI